MHWKFEKVISISVFHQRTKEEPPADPSAYQPEFSVTPAPKTMQRFRNMAWGVRPVPGGLDVFAERIIRQNGTSFSRSAPVPNEAFDFYLHLQQPVLLGQTLPYVVEQADAPPKPNDDLPSFSGQSRLLYLDNIDAVVIDEDGSQIIQLTEGDYTGLSEFASRATTPFIYTRSAADAQKVTAVAIDPSGTARSHDFEFEPDANSVTMKLPANAWEIKEEPSGKTETILLTDRGLPGDVFGLIRIFNTEQLRLDQHRRYQALFARAQ